MGWADPLEWLSPHWRLTLQHPVDSRGESYCNVRPDGSALVGLKAQFQQASAYEAESGKPDMNIHIE